MNGLGWFVLGLIAGEALTRVGRWDRDREARRAERRRGARRWYHPSPGARRPWLPPRSGGYPDPPRDGYDMAPGGPSPKPPPGPSGVSRPCPMKGDLGHRCDGDHR